MQPRSRFPRRRPAAAAAFLGVLALGGVVALLGAVAGEEPSHEPVALEPDAPRQGGAAVATFALG
jgi:hypothetical protein